MGKDLKLDIEHPEIIGMEKYEPTSHESVFVDPELNSVCVLLDYDQAVVLLFDDHRDDWLLSIKTS